MTFRILATPRSFCNTPGPHLDLLEAAGCEVVRKAGEHPLSSAALAALIPGFDAAILGLDQCDAAVFAAADRLKTIARFGVGVDAIDRVAAAAHGVVITNTPNTNHLAVAELTIGLLFALARQIPAVAASARAGLFRRHTGWELSGKTLGVLGFGAIGRAVAERAHLLGMRVLACDPFWDGEAYFAVNAPLETLWREADAVSLHLPYTPETAGLISGEVLDRMRPGAVIVNTARGGLIDEDALYERLVSGHIGGAALDAFAHEPPTGSPLLTLDNVIATPHMGGSTREAVARTGLLAARNCLAVLRGEPTPHIVAPPG
jgi:D-3-phosphoglycerate dehydrogenase